MLTFFGEIKKEGRKVSGARCRSAQPHQEKFRGWKSARRLWRFLYLKYLRAPALNSFIHAGFGASPRHGENWKNAWCESVGVSPKRGGLQPAYLGHFQNRCSGALVSMAFQSTMPANALFIRASEVLARRRPIHTGLRACPFAYSITTKHPNPLRRSRRRGVAWRNQGLDCLSVSELSNPPPGQPAARSFLRLGSPFFADFLWRDKERR